MYREAGARRYAHFNPEYPYSVLERRLVLKLKKLGESKNKAKFTQVYGGELVVSDN